jgi:hypothetical protein
MTDFNNPLDAELLQSIGQATREVWGDDLTRPTKYVIGRLNSDGSTSTVVSSGEYNRVWVRNPGDDTGDAVQAVNPQQLQPHEISFNRPVMCKPQRGELVIVGRAIESADYQANYNPRPQTPIYRTQYKSALIYPSSPTSFIVKYYGAMFKVDGVPYNVVDKTSSDFTSTVPGSNALSIKVEVDPVTGTWHETTGSSFTTSSLEDAFTNGDLDTTTTVGRFLIGWIRLYNGQTAIEREDVLMGEWMLANNDSGGGFWNGTIVESFDAVVSSDGTIITTSLAQSGGGDLSMIFSDGVTQLDTTPAKTITLTAGSTASPQGNWIYIPKSTKVLTKSTSAWPTAEHIKVGFFFVQSASDVQGDGALINQNWNDHKYSTSGAGIGQGHLSHITQRIRTEGAIYFSGVDGNGSDDYTTSAAGDVTVQWTSGIISQMHQHTIPAADTSGTDDIHVVNAHATDGGAYFETQNLYDITVDTNGNTLTNKYFNIVLWGVGNKTGEYAPVMCNIPTGSYNTQAAAESDTSGFDVFTIPRQFNIDSSTGFLIARLTFRKTGGSWTWQSTVDLRGLTPATAATGAGGGAATSFADNAFQIYNVADNTKILEWDLAGLTTATTRQWVAQDANGTVALMGNLLNTGNFGVNGAVGIGVNPGSALGALDVTSTTEPVVLPRMTTAQRNAMASQPDGALVYNTDTDQFEGAAASAWGSLGAMVLLAEGEETSDAASITITGWPTSNPAYAKLVLDVVGMESDKSGNADGLLVRFNGDNVATSYDSENDNAAGNTASAAESIGSLAGMRCHRVVAATNSDADHFGTAHIELYRPEDTGDYKMGNWIGGASSETTNEFRHSTGTGTWESDSAITTILLVPETGTTFLIGGAGEPTKLTWKLYGVY